VLAQELADDLISSLDAAVAATHAVTAEHHQIPPDVVSWMLEHMVEREPQPLEAPAESDRVAEGALLPFAMERIQQRPIANSRFRLRVYQQPAPAQW